MPMGPAPQQTVPSYPPPRRPSSGTRGPVLAAVGCTVAFFLIVIIAAVLAAVDTDDPTPSYSPPPIRTSDSFTTSANTVTADFEGTWKGTGYQTKPDVTHWDVEIILIEGVRYGTVKYPSCSGILQVVSSSTDELVMRQTITTGADKCAQFGYVTLSSPGNTTVRFAYSDEEDAVTPNASGTLFKE